MDCPQCNSQADMTEGPDGSLNFHCPSCGWGTGMSAAEAAVPAGPAKMSGGHLALYWLGAGGVIIIPYLALRFGVPPLVADLDRQFELSLAERFVSGLDIHYWWVIAIYIFLSAAFNPAYDPDNVGWFGGWVDNPFSWQDDYERGKRSLAFLLLPGKIVVVALVNTYRLIFK